MSRQKAGGNQTRNRSLIPQKLRHFFASFPDSYEFPALPDWLLHRPMGSVWCVPKSPQKQPAAGATRRETARRNRIEPESNAQFLPAPRRRSSRRANRVADLTYKNTWSSFLKTAKSDQVRFFPLKSAGRSLDDSAALNSSSLDVATARKCPLSSSPVRRRAASSMRAHKKSEANKALREAWLNENVFPQFSRNFSARSASALFDDEPVRRSRTSRKHSNDYVLREFIENCSTPVRRERYRAKRDVHNHGSVEANVSSGTTDTMLTPGSMDNSATSTLATTSGSVNVNATSSPTSSFDSMQARYSAAQFDYDDRRAHSRRLPDESLETSQSVEAQVSSTSTGPTQSSASMRPHMSSESSNGFPPPYGNLSAERVAREVLLKERAISSANSRKSCLKGSGGRQSRPTTRPARVSHFKDPSRLEWTKRYLFTLAPPSSLGYSPNQHDRSSSMSRMSSSDNWNREFQVYHVQQRPWQSFPDLRLQKWPPTSSNLALNVSSGADESLDVVDFIKKKKQLLSQLFQAKAVEDDPYRTLKQEMRSLTFGSPSYPARCLSAGRSRSSDQHASGFYGELARLRANATITSGSSSNAKIKSVQKSATNDSLTLSDEPLGSMKKPNQSCSTIVAPFRFSTENILKAGGKFLPSTLDRTPIRVTPPTPRRKAIIASAKSRSPDKRPHSSVSKLSSSNALQSFSAPLQPASGENKASALRKSMTQRQREDELMKTWLKQQRERERKNRLRAIRLDPAWAQVRGADQAIEDIAHRRCYKEVVERERLLQYYMDKEEMLNRVWQMPPLFERQSAKTDKVFATKKEAPPPTPTPQQTDKSTAAVNPVNIKFSGNSRQKKTTKASFRTNSKTEENLDCYLASESLQLSRPSTAKSTKSASKRA